MRPALLILSLVTAFAAGSGAVGAESPSPSTYQTSCVHIGVIGKTLYADCRRNAGGFKRAALPIAAIENRNGSLRFTSMYRASTFQDSCKDIAVAGNVLYATCRRDDGGFNETSIIIPGIANVDGDLRYRDEPGHGK
jgi:hypothetical protein